MDPTTNIINTIKSIDGDKNRRKRLKVVSACGECRRKKTKCNGEQPCTGCIKSNVECKYISHKQNHQQQQKKMIHPILPPPTQDRKRKATSIESIEERLNTIENILRILLGSENNNKQPHWFRDTHGTLLAPIKPCHTVAIPTIKHLLNEERPSSAFFRLNSSSSSSTST